MQNNFKVNRPLLNVHRIEIRQFVRFWKLPIYSDQSNQKTNYLRNKIRKHLMPTLRILFNPQIDTVLLNFIEVQKSEQLYFRNVLNLLLAPQECYPLFAFSFLLSDPYSLINESPYLNAFDYSWNKSFESNAKKLRDGLYSFVMSDFQLNKKENTHSSALGSTNYTYLLYPFWAHRSPKIVGVRGINRINIGKLCNYVTLRAVTPKNVQNVRFVRAKTLWGAGRIFFSIYGRDCDKSSIYLNRGMLLVTCFTPLKLVRLQVNNITKTKNKILSTKNLSGKKFISKYLWLLPLSTVNLSESFFRLKQIKDDLQISERGASSKVAHRWPLRPYVGISKITVAMRTDYQKIRKATRKRSCLYPLLAKFSKARINYVTHMLIFDFLGLVQDSSRHPKSSYLKFKKCYLIRALLLKDNSKAWETYELARHNQLMFKGTLLAVRGGSKSEMIVLTQLKPSSCVSITQIKQIFDLSDLYCTHTHIVKLCQYGSVFTTYEGKRIDTTNDTALLCYRSKKLPGSVVKLKFTQKKDNHKNDLSISKKDCAKLIIQYKDYLAYFSRNQILYWLIINNNLIKRLNCYPNIFQKQILKTILKTFNQVEDAISQSYSITNSAHYHSEMSQKFNKIYQNKQDNEKNLTHLLILKFTKKLFVLREKRFLLFMLRDLINKY